MIGSIVLYHPDADAPGLAALVVGVNPPAVLDDATGETGQATLNLIVFPDDDGTAPELPADAAADGADDDLGGVVEGWLPYRAVEVVRDQPGKAVGAYWSPVV